MRILYENRIPVRVLSDMDGCLGRQYLHRDFVIIVNFFSGPEISLVEWRKIG